MSINQNDITLILGKKGTGKTTLVLHHLLNSLLSKIDTLLIISNDKESYHHITNNVFSTKGILYMDKTSNCDIGVSSFIIKNQSIFSNITELISRSFMYLNESKNKMKYEYDMV
jgi:ABC-type cobalamin/Fe3+-siderophores transport system ATPase subunit